MASGGLLLLLLLRRRRLVLPRRSHSPFLHSIRSQQNHLPKFSISSSSSSYSLSLTSLVSHHPFPDLNFFGTPTSVVLRSRICVCFGGLLCVCFFLLPDFDAIARSETPELRKSVCFCWPWEFVFLLLFGVFFFLFLFFVLFQIFGRAGVFLIVSGGDLILKEILLDRSEEFFVQLT